MESAITVKGQATGTETRFGAYPAFHALMALTDGTAEYQAVAEERKHLSSLLSEFAVQ
jgi:hypothetical protein